MSLTRRLQRIIQSHLGAWREDPFDDPKTPDARPADSASEAPSAGEGAGSDVPPDVAEAYRALEVPVGSDRDAVKAGYRRVMKKYHQDRFQRDDEKREVAGEVSKRLNLAYQCVIEYLDEEGS